MSMLSVNGIDITYTTESINNDTQYRLTIVSFGGMSSTPEYGGQKTISLKCDGKTFISNTSKWPSSTKTENIHEYLEATELETARQFTELQNSNPSNLQKQWTKGRTARNYTLTLSVFGKVARATVTVPSLPVEDPGINETVHVNPDSGYTSELMYNVKTKEDEVVLTLKTIKVTRTLGKTGSTTVTIKLDKVQVYKQTHTSGTFAISGVSKTVARTKKDKRISISLSAKTSEENAVDHPITTEVLVPKLESKVRQYTTIKKVNNNKEYLVNTAAYQNYGRIEALVEFGDIDDASKLKEYAQLYVNNMQFDDISLTLSVVDLHLLNSDIDTLDLLDQVKCVSYPHGVNRYFIVSEIQIPLDDPSNIQFTLGKKAISGSMSAKSTKAATDFVEKLTFLPNVANALASAQAEMTDKLNQRTTGYVNIVQENDISQALVISDTEDWTQASALWKFDMNGLGFSNSTTADENYTGLSDTVDGRWYKYGMTMDGTIVADMIKTGTLSDGMGYNYWNMATGEFRLSHNNIISGAGDSLTIGDISESTQESLNIQTGAINYLNCTDYWEMDNNGRYENCKWATKIVVRPSRSLTTTVKSAALAVSGESADLPNVICKRALIFKPNAYVIDTIHVTQIAIPTEIGTVYTLSFYYKRKHATDDVPVSNIFVEIDTQKKQITSVTSNWQRATYTFRATTKTNTIKLGITCGTTATITKNQSDKIYISGVMLNLGNKPSDWSASPTDDQIHLYKYIDAIHDGDLGWTDAQINAWTASLTQETIFNRLMTHVDANGQEHVAQAIKMDANGDLYINGSYIKADTMSASVIKTGILSDYNRTNWWNLNTGVLHTKGMIATNGQFTGKITTVLPSSSTSSSPKPSIVMTNGHLNFKQYLNYKSKNNYVEYDCGSIGSMSEVYDVASDGSRSGPLTIRHTYGGLRIETPALLTRTGYVRVTETYTRTSSTAKWKKSKTERKRINSNWYRGFTGAVALGTVVREKNKNAYATTYLHFVNGFFITANLKAHKNAMAKYASPTWSYFDNDLTKKKTKDLGIDKNMVMPQNTDKIKGNTRTITKYKKIM